MIRSFVLGAALLFAGDAWADGCADRDLVFDQRVQRCVDSRLDCPEPGKLVVRPGGVEICEYPVVEGGYTISCWHGGVPGVDAKTGLLECHKPAHTPFCDEAPRAEVCLDRSTGVEWDW